MAPDGRRRLPSARQTLVERRGDSLCRRRRLGTVLSFELGLLWPRFMQFAGPIIGMPLSLEGFAFFTEAIFLGIYLYGRDRVSPRTLPAPCSTE